MLTGSHTLSEDTAKFTILYSILGLGLSGVRNGVTVRVSSLSTTQFWFGYGLARVYLGPCKPRIRVTFNRDSIIDMHSPASDTSVSSAPSPQSAVHLSSSARLMQIAVGFSVRL